MQQKAGNSFKAFACLLRVLLLLLSCSIVHHLLTLSGLHSLRGLALSRNWDALNLFSLAVRWNGWGWTLKNVWRENEEPLFCLHQKGRPRYIRQVFLASHIWKILCQLTCLWYCLDFAVVRGWTSDSFDGKLTELHDCWAESTFPTFFKNVVQSQQCDQIGRYFGLWATF